MAKLIELHEDIKPFRRRNQTNKIGRLLLRQPFSLN